MIAAKGTARDVAEHVPRAVLDHRSDASRRTKVEQPFEHQERATLVAHDLKTPLAIIMLETQLLGEKLPVDQLPAVQHSLERIAQNAAYIDRLIADLLDLASVDAGQLQVNLRPERLDLAALLRETVDRAVSSVDRGRVRLDLHGRAIVRADRNRLERVVANFLGNALKYSASAITVALGVKDGRARVAVVDRGRGLTPEQARTVFDRYRRAANTRGREGHGLGLYISRKIIDAHHGRIGVVSTVGKGSEFFFELDTLR